MFIDEITVDGVPVDCTFKELLQGVSDHYALSDQTSAVREQVINGQADESALLDATKEMADHAQSLLEQVQNAKWKTEYYKEHVELLTAAVEALAQGEQLAYEAGLNNDDSKLEEVADLLADYNEKIDELLILMGL